MTGIASLHDQLLRDEGVRLKVYNDALGVPTIGVGRNLRDRGISLAEAEVLLTNDIRDAASNVQAELPWSMFLDEVRRGVLSNIAFNVGIKGLLGFKKMLTAIQANDWKKAALELLDSKYHQEVGVRAERLAEQLVTGQWQ